MDILFSILALSVAFVALYLAADATQKVDAKIKQQVDRQIRALEHELARLSEEQRTQLRRIEVSETTRLELAKFSNEIAKEIAVYDEKIGALKAELTALATRERNSRPAKRAEPNEN